MIKTWKERLKDRAIDPFPWDESKAMQVEIDELRQENEELLVKLAIAEREWKNAYRGHKELLDAAKLALETLQFLSDCSGHPPGTLKAIRALKAAGVTL